jgi:hypothetical protein
MDLVGSKLEGEFDVPDDTTEDDIAEAVREAALNHVNWGWEKVEPKP